MIRVSRPREPDALRKTRDVKLARARLDMAAVRPRASPKWLDLALLAACENAPRTRTQLVALTKRSEGIVDGGLTRLVDAGRLALNGPCYEPVP